MKMDTPRSTKANPSNPCTFEFGFSHTGADQPHEISIICSEISEDDYIMNFEDKKVPTGQPHFVFEEQASSPSKS